MVKRISLTCMAALLMGQMSFAFEPHHEPLVKQSPPNPNIYMILDTSGSMDERDMEWEGVRRTSRIKVLREVTKDLVKRYRYDAYIGYGTLGYLGYRERNSNYNYDVVKQEILDLSNDTSLSTITNQINKLEAYGGTPLAFSLYETAKYFRGEKMLNRNLGRRGVTYHSKIASNPIRYRCQEQHLILMTDGAPMGDVTGAILSRDRRDMGVSDRSETYRNQPTSAVGKFLWNLDLRTDAQNIGNKDLAGKEWLSKGSKRMPLHINAITFGNDTSNANIKELDRTVAPSGGVHVHAKDATALYEAFHQIFQDIIQTRSGTGAIEDQTAQTKQSIRYSTAYEPRIWTGELVARQFNETTKKYDKLLWSTKDTIVPNQGKFFTTNDAFTSTNKTPSDKKVVLGPSTPGIDSNYANWLKGTESSNLRDRQGNLLGAIINSDITYFATDVPRINLDTLSSTMRMEFINFIKFRRDNMRYNLLIGGSNDGLLNFIYADKNGGGKNREAGQRFVSYFPSFFKEDLPQITDLYYTHQYKIDGKNHLFDALDGDTFRTIGISSMAAGRKGLVGYQLFEATRDLTDPSTDFKVNFEITNQTPGFSDLGYTYSEVDFVNQFDGGEQKDRVFAVFGNGFGAESGKSIIYIIDAITGEKINSITLSNDGLGAASPSLVVQNAKGGLQHLSKLYVGDYSGKLYKVVFEPFNEKFEVQKMVTLYDTKGSNEKAGVRPITTRPTLNQDRDGMMWIYFGTGSAATLDDISDDAQKVTHYLYGLRDLDHTLYRNDLVGQSIKKIDENEGEKDVYTTQNATSPAQNGWFISLAYNNEPDGNRVIFSPVVIGDSYLNFSTWAIVRGEEGDPCLGDVSSGSQISLDLLTGNASPLNGEENGPNGTHLDDDAYGRPTGPTVEGENSFGGNYNNGYIEELANNEFGSHIKPDKEADSSVVWDTLGGDTKTETIPPPYKQNNGLEPGRLYLKTIAIN